MQLQLVGVVAAELLLPLLLFQSNESRASLDSVFGGVLNAAANSQLKILLWCLEGHCHLAIVICKSAVRSMDGCSIVVDQQEKGI